MKKRFPLLALLLLVAIVGLFALDHYRKERAQQREQTAGLLASCVNQGLLSLFRLQANDWRRRPDFLAQQQRKLEDAVAALPEKILAGQPFAEWQNAVAVCKKLTRHSVVQHGTIFRALDDLAAPAMTDSRTYKDPGALKRRLRTLNRLRNSAKAAGRYLDDLRTDVRTQLQRSDLSAASREQALAEINRQVLEHYRPGHFSVQQVDSYLARLESYYRLLAQHPRGFSLRGGSLYFHDIALRRQIEQLNSAILQGDAAFYANWSQIVARQQGGFDAG
ncbi:hypothetical protein [Microbulbifer sp. SAOS-129_SWC]|uniref:hypothetical protein n=1 Tax=Microbulbifer sp. SAOS-129_SWC TaxID=3145235 RepID=UPI003217F15F